MKDLGLFKSETVDKFIQLATQCGAELYCNYENASLLDGDFCVIEHSGKRVRYNVITEQYLNCWSSAYRVKRYYNTLPKKWQRHFGMLED